MSISDVYNVDSFGTLLATIDCRFFYWYRNEPIDIIINVCVLNKRYKLITATKPPAAYPLIVNISMNIILYYV